jgi:hypothetical protein
MSRFSDLLAQAEFGSPLVDRPAWTREGFEDRFTSARTRIGMTEELGRWNPESRGVVGSFTPALVEGRVSDAAGNWLEDLEGVWTSPEGVRTDIEGNLIGAPPSGGGGGGGYTPPYPSRGGIYGIAAELLRTYGFNEEDIAGLVDFIKESLIMGDDAVTITQRLRERPEYERRFPAMKLRQAAGFNAISELQYLELEDAYRQTLRAANMPVGFYDEPSDFATLIELDVSANEFQRRVSLAYQFENEANADVVKQLKELYNLGPEWVAAYYLDPKKTEDLILQEQQMRTAELSSAVMNTIGAGLTKRAAERMEQASIGVSDIPKLSQRVGMVSRLIGEEAMTASEIATGSFGIDTAAATKLRRRGEGRLTPFAGNAGVLVGEGGLSGFGAART